MNCRISSIASSILAISLFVTVMILPALVFAGPAAIRDRADEVLSRMKGLGAHEIEVEVGGSVIEVTGHVGSEDARTRVESALRSIEGVSNVRNDLRIGSNTTLREQTILENIRSEIRANNKLKGYDVNIELSDSQIMLQGKAGSVLDSAALESIARRHSGSMRVVNNLKVDTIPTIPDAEVTQRVIDSIKQEGIAALSGVTLSTHEGVVTFRGAVSNHREIDKMLSLALMVEGVKSVRSEVAVNQPR